MGHPLQRLHDIVVPLTREDLQVWTACNTGQMDALSAALLEGLQLWSFTLDILRDFCHVLAFRDAVVLQSPSLLDELLVAANGSSQGFRRFSGVCVALLSEPLPLEVPLPLSAQAFLDQLAEKAIQQPSPATVEPVYLILDGACGALLDLLSPSALRTFREPFRDMIRTVKSIEEQILTLLCLAILAKVHQRCMSPAMARLEKESSLSSSMSAHDREELSGFFTGEKAQKTITLVAYQVINACRPQHKTMKIDALKHITLSRLIVNVVDPRAREQWANSQAAIVDKLHQKIAQDGLDVMVRLEVRQHWSLPKRKGHYCSPWTRNQLCSMTISREARSLLIPWSQAYALTCLLSQTRQLPQSTVAAYHRALCELDCISVSDRIFSSALSVPFPQLLVSLLRGRD